MVTVTVLGSGMWGTTLSIMLAGKGYHIRLWTRNKDVYDDILNNRKNQRYTKESLLPENIEPCHSKEIKNIFTDSEIVLFAVPSHALREVIAFFKEKLQQYEEKIISIVNAAKGLEFSTNMRLSEVFELELPEKLKNKTAFISGPNIAPEILKKLPSVSAVSSANSSLLEYLQKFFTTEYFRVYTNNDLAGTEICAAVKNIIAIAAGISDGLGYGSNAKASLITRGLYELSRFGALYGANPATFSGIAGMGDLIATCISPLSRNRRVGEMLAEGNKIEEIMKNIGSVAEGINTTKSVYEISKEKNIDLPITESVYNIIYEGMPPLESVNRLMSRKFKPEV